MALHALAVAHPLTTPVCALCGLDYSTKPLPERYTELRAVPDEESGTHLVCADQDGACTEAVLGWRDRLTANAASVQLATVLPLRRRP